MEFKGDEARNSFKALKLVEEGEIPLTSSISSTGINEPPVFMYLLSLPFIFSTSPVFATGFIALMNVAAIVILFFLIKNYFSVQAALISVALYAVNPWQVLFSRKMWTQNLLAPFVILFIYLILEAVIKKKKEYIIYSLLILGIILQLHLSAIYFVALAGLIIILYYKDVKINYLIAGIVLCLITFIPYLIFQINNNFADLHTILTHFKQERIFHSSAFLMPLTLFSTNGFEYSFGNDFNEFLHTAYKLPLIDYLSVTLLLFSLGYFLLNMNKLKWIFFSWLIFGVLYLFTNRAPILYEHYFNSISPVLFIITGVATASLIKTIPVWAKYGVSTIILMIVVYQSAFTLNILNFIKKKECIDGDYGVPYEYRKNNILSGVNNLSVSYIEENIQTLHESTCHCVKCDIPATHFIIKHLRKDYVYWPIIEK
ncbi:MAG: glycosyltransferase family 39 protein [Bacteroidia bacterium]